MLQQYDRDGQWDSSGAFTLDRQKALEKIARYQLPHPDAWVLKLAQAAVLAGSDFLDLLDQIYDVQYTALDADVQNTMARLQSHEAVMEDELALRCGKAVALLELVQDQEPTTPALVACCLYPRVGAGNLEPHVEKALEKLYSLNFLSRSEKHGYKIQSSAGEEWARERDGHGITSQAISDLLREKLRDLLGQADRPRYKNRPFPIAALYSDGRGAREERLLIPNDPAVVWFDFHYLTRPDERKEEHWLKESDSDSRRDRILWISGSAGNLEARTRELLRSRQMVNRYAPRLHSLPEARQRLYFEEQTRRDLLETEVAGLLSEIFLDGTLYFRARILEKQRYGGSFPGVLEGAGTEVLPLVYQHFVDVAITETEMQQLLQPTLSGVSAKFLAGGLGLLELDAGKYVASCTGEVPTRIREYVQAENGVSGARLLAHFGGPPSGYPADVVRACVLGMLRGGHVVVRPASGVEKITSVRDPGVQDLFRKDKDFKQADILPAGEQLVKPQDRIRICKFFSKSLGVELERDNEHIADAVGQHFPVQAERWRQLQTRLRELPGRPALPKPLELLNENLEKCMRSRMVEDRVFAVRKLIEPLTDGLQELGMYLGDLTEAAIEQVKHAERVRTIELEQLRQLELDPELETAVARIGGHLSTPCPWREIGSLKDPLEHIVGRYRELREEYLQQQDQQADRIRERIKLREGFSKLDGSQADTVLRPIREAVCDTTPEAVSPPLVYLRDSVPARLRESAEAADRRLDELLADFDVQVVQVKTELCGRELASLDEVEALLAELRERLLAQLKPDTRIRLV